jgi:hypothetical protein
MYSLDKLLLIILIRKDVCTYSMHRLGLSQFEKKNPKEKRWQIIECFSKGTAGEDNNIFPNKRDQERFRIFLNGRGDEWWSLFKVHGSVFLI